MKARGEGAPGHLILEKKKKKKLRYLLMEIKLQSGSQWHVQIEDGIISNWFATMIEMPCI